MSRALRSGLALVLGLGGCASLAGLTGGPAAGDAGDSDGGDAGDSGREADVAPDATLGSDAPLDSIIRLDAPADSSGLPDGATTDGADPGDSGGPSDSASPTDGGPDGSMGPDGSGGRDSTTGGPDGNSFDSSVNACPSAQTQFGGAAHGDANAHFTSGVGVRTPTQILIFSTYVGPAVSGIDAGIQSDAGTVSIMYVQGFDPVTGASAGPAAPAFAIPNLPGVRLEDASISPDGKIVLLFGYGPFFGYGASSSLDSPLYAAFVTPQGSNGGPPVIAVEQIVVLEAQQFYGQPHATWSVSASAFSLSWEAYSALTSFYIDVSNFTSSGTGAGGGANMVPSALVSAASFDQGSVGAGDGLTGVVFAATGNNNPYLTILDALGNAVGGTISLGANNSNWSTVGGTSRGFVALTLSSSTVIETFVGTSADGGIASAGDAGLPTHAFPGTGAVGGRAISDDTGGVGGVGAALLYPDGVSFVYVCADGTTWEGPLSLLAAAHVYGDLTALTNYGGSFSVSLYSPTDGSTLVAASGCP